MRRLCWVDREPRSAAHQMALDLAAARYAIQHGFALLRWYQWERDTLSFGAHEAATRTWHRERLELDGIAVVRRPTGGRGVWHAADDLTYAWTGPLSNRGSAPNRYRELHEAMAAVLRTNGLAAGVTAVATGRADLSPGACFDLTLGGEITVNGRKAVGAAQRCFPGGLLQHGAIARGDHRAVENRYLRTPPRPARSSQEEWPSAEALAEALEQDELSRGAESAPRELTDTIVTASVAELDTFRDLEWTWRR